MRRSVLLLLALALAACGPEAPSSVADDLGRTVALDGTPETVFPLAPNLTELVAVAAGMDRLAGVGRSDDFPAGVAQKPRVQTLPLDLEALVALAPSLALGSDDVNTADAADGLEALGIPTYLFRFDEVADVPRALRTLDTLLAVSGGAPAAADFERRVAAVRETVQPFSAPRVLLLVGTETLYAFGRDSYASELVRLAGGDNLTDAFEGARAEPSDEVVLQMAPEVIVVLSKDFDPAALLRDHPTFFTLPAVVNSRVYGLDPAFVSRPGPRLVDGLERLARLLHPEAFAAGAA
jgi:iron complex transport system substrate-binding protein